MPSAGDVAGRGRSRSAGTQIGGKYLKYNVLMQVKLLGYWFR